MFLLNSIDSWCFHCYKIVYTDCRPLTSETEFINKLYSEEKDDWVVIKSLPRGQSTRTSYRPSILPADRQSPSMKLAPEQPQAPADGRIFGIGRFVLFLGLRSASLGTLAKHQPRRSLKCYPASDFSGLCACTSETCQRSSRNLLISVMSYHAC